MKCDICNDTGIDERNPDYCVACDCEQGTIAHEYHLAGVSTAPTIGEWVEQLWEEGAIPGYHK